MELNDLRIFRTVIHEGGITRAAERLHRVQSNVTTRIKQLEADLGVTLFTRTGKQLQPTAAAHVLSGYAEQLLRLADEARAAVADDTPRGPLRVGSMESTAATRLPAVLSGFHARHPAVDLELRTGPTSRLLAHVLDGRLDCALISGPLSDERFDSTAVFREELMLVAARDHPPIKHPTDLQVRTLLTFEAGCAYRLRLESWLAAEGVVPQRIVELASYHTMVGCAASGMGVALVPESLLAHLSESSGVSRHRLPAPIARAQTLLIRLKGRHHPGVDALLKTLKDTIATSAKTKPSPA